MDEIERVTDELRQHIQYQLEEHPTVYPVFLHQKGRIAFRFLDFSRTIYSRWSLWLSEDEVHPHYFDHLDDEIHRLLSEVSCLPN